MPIFAQLENEDEVQLNDRTRLDASKSYQTNNQPSFTKLTIKPCLNEVQYSVYSTNQIQRYLDWEFRNWEIDIDNSNNKLNFKEYGSELTATLTAGTYTLATLASQIQTQMNAVGGQVYTISVDIDDKITFSAPGTFQLLVKTGSNKYSSILKQLFLGELDLTNKASYTSSRIEYLTRKMTVYVGEDRQQIDTVTCYADVAGSLNSKYFFLYSGGDSTKYYCWYDVSGGGVDPAISGATGVQIAISTGDNANAVALATASAIDGLAAFSASSLLSVVTITHVSSEWNTAPTNGNLIGFSFATTVSGEKQDTESNYIKVYSVLGDKLFSDDSDLMQFEPDIRKWVVAGRNSFLNIHRQAQKHILEWLDREGYETVFMEKYKKSDIIEIDEFKEWSRFAALRMIFEGIKSSQDDVFQQKKATYESKEITARQRAILRIDTDGSGDLHLNEGLDPYSIRLGFR